METLRTPAHPDSLAALLPTPLTGTCDPPAAQRPSQSLVHGVVEGLAMPVPRGRHGPHRLPCGLRPPRDVSGLRQVRAHPVRPAVPQAVPCPATPPAGVGRPPRPPGGRALPQRLRRVRKVHKAPCVAREALRQAAPPSAAAVAAPDHLGGLHEALAPRVAPPPRPERLASPKTAPRRRCCSRVPPWPRRASTPPVMARPRIFPVGAPPRGRHGTSTPSAPTARGQAASAAATAAGGGASPRATAASASWRRALAWWPAAWPQPPTARGRTRPPPSPLSHRAAVAQGTKTAPAQPRHGRAPRVRGGGGPPSAAAQGATWGLAPPWGPRPTRRRPWRGPTRRMRWRWAHPVRRHGPTARMRGASVGAASIVLSHGGPQGSS